MLLVVVCIDTNWRLLTVFVCYYLLSQYIRKGMKIKSTDRISNNQPSWWILFYCIDLWMCAILWYCNNQSNVQYTATNWSFNSFIHDYHWSKHFTHIIFKNWNEWVKFMSDHHFQMSFFEFSQMYSNGKACLANLFIVCKISCCCIGCYHVLGQISQRGFNSLRWFGSFEKLVPNNYHYLICYKFYEDYLFLLYVTLLLGSM